MNPFDALGNPIRRAILAELRQQSLPVGELAARFEVSRPAVSRHLSVLQQAGLVEVRESGNQNIYTVRVEGFAEVRSYIDSFWDAALSRLASLTRH